MAAGGPSAIAPRPTSSSILILQRPAQSELINVVPLDSIVQSNRLTCISDAAQPPQHVAEIPRWREELGDLSLSGFPDAIAPSPTYSDVAPFVNRLSSDPNDVHPRSNSQSLPSNSAHHFQYMLMAPTSAAVPISEESLTYLNQHQSYEIRCKKMSASHQRENVLYRTVVSLCFHNRRQRFEERDLMDGWRKYNPNVKPIDIDLPLSVNVYQTYVGDNYVEFLWDPSPTKTTMLFVKVALLSTHFTEKKQGGEKGVPFRLVINTFTHDGRETKQVHSAYAQIRVFKLKGADRKNKTDRERAEKHNDREHFQPAYDYTIFTESYPLEVTDVDLPSNDKDPSDVVVSEQLKAALDADDHGTSPVDEIMEPAPLLDAPPSSSSLPTLLSCNASVLATNDWLKQNGFAHFLHVFEHFNAVDLLRLSRQDLERLCRNAAEGVRLFNALHAKPRLTIFVRLCDDEGMHTALFLHQLTVPELREKLKELMKDELKDVPVLIVGPRDISVIVTDELISNWADLSIYSASVVGDHPNRQLILREAVDSTP